MLTLYRGDRFRNLWEMIDADSWTEWFELKHRVITEDGRKVARAVAVDWPAIDCLIPIEEIQTMLNEAKKLGLVQHNASTFYRRCDRCYRWRPVTRFNDGSKRCGICAERMV